MTTLQNSMLKKGKKGFTLTELAIVIAVIAILIAVLVPTFTSVITNARKTTATESAKNAMTEFTIETYETLPNGTVIESGDYYVTVEDGTVSTDNCVAITDDNKITTTSTNYVQYVWAEAVDSALEDLKIYISTTDLTSSLAETIAENIADTYDSTKTVTEILVSGSSSYYFSVTTTSSVRTVKYEGSTYTTTSGASTDTSSYVGITIYLQSA